MNQNDYVSNCCGSSVEIINRETMEGVCFSCKEYCEAELSEEAIEELQKEASYPAI